MPLLITLNIPQKMLRSLLNMFKRSEHYVETNDCKGCKKRFQLYKKHVYSIGTNAHPGPLHNCLKNLTRAEEYCIAMQQQTICVFTTKGIQKHYTGHAISVNVDHEEFMNQLPKAMDKLGFIVVKSRKNNPNIKDLRIRRGKVIQAYVNRYTSYLKERILFTSMFSSIKMS